MRPVVFLDIDGVLNSGKNYANWSAAHKADEEDPNALIMQAQRGQPITERHIELLFDPENVRVLNKITEAVGADIVISSSWRNFYWNKFDELIDLLKRVGVTAPVIGRTAQRSKNGIQRGNEIVDWLAENQPDGGAVLVLDDCDDMDAIWPFFLQTDGSKGLVESDVEKALDILDMEGWELC